MKSLEWVKPIINTKKALEEDVSSLHDSQQSQINQDLDDSNVMDDEDVGFKIPTVQMRDPRQEHWLRRTNISGKSIELVELKTEEDMRTLKNSMRLRFPVLMATIIKILLYRKENKLACLLTSMYEISIDSEMLASAIKFDKWEWLEYVWVFGKNWLGARRNEQFASKITY